MNIPVGIFNKIKSKATDEAKVMRLEQEALTKKKESESKALIEKDKAI